MSKEGETIKRDLKGQMQLQSVVLDDVLYCARDEKRQKLFLIIICTVQFCKTYNTFNDASLHLEVSL